MATNNGSTPSKQTHELISGHVDAVQVLQYMDEEPNSRSGKGSRKSDVAIPMEDHAVVQETSSSRQQDQTDAAAQSTNDNDAINECNSPRRPVKQLPISDEGPAISVESATPTEDESHQKDGKIHTLLTRLHLRRKDKETKKEANQSQPDDINPSLLHPEWQSKTEKGKSTEADKPKAVQDALKNMRMYRCLLYVIGVLAVITAISAILIILSMTGIISLRID